MSKLFAFGHATHPQWAMAAALVLAQLRALLKRPDHAGSPNLGLLYITDHYAEHAPEILDHLSAQLPEVADWAGTVGVGIASNNVEYFDEPAMAVMLCELPADQVRVFSGVAPLAASGRGFEAHTALVHADPGEPELAELIAELAQRTRSGYLFGGLAASRGQVVQFAQSGRGHLRGQGAAGSVFAGGLSGVAFGPEVALISRVSQGCQPISLERTITACDDHVVLELDGQPALDVLLADLQVSLDEPQTALTKVRRTLVGLRPPPEPGERKRSGPFGADTLVRHIIGLDPARQAVAVAQTTEVGMRLSFCERHAAAARSDLVRICAEIREELEVTESAEMLAQPVMNTEPQRRIAGAVYVSCSGRGGPHFGGPSAELQIVRRALGDVPLVGFFAAGEIAGRSVYGYTGVLTVFAVPS